MVEATARILERYGYDKISTNKVAESAGVSVGSLYQYFPGKDALVAAVFEYQAERVMGNFENEIRATAGMPPVKRIEDLVRTSVEFYLKNSKVNRELFALSANKQVVNFTLGLRRRAAALIAEIIDTELAVPSANEVAYIIVNSIMGVVLTSILDEETPLPHERVIQELTTMVKGYLGL